MSLLLLGCLQQLAARPLPVLGEKRVEAHHQALARVLHGRDLREVALVKQRHLDRPRLHQRSDCRSPQCGDPAQPRVCSQGIDARVRQHPPVTDQDHPRQLEPPLQPLHLRRYRRRVARVAGAHLHRHRTTLRIRQHAVRNARQLLPIPVVTTPSQHAGLPLVRARRQVDERQASLAKMPSRQLRLDPTLPLHQPVQSPIQLVHVGALHPTLLPQRAARPRPRRRQLGARVKHPLRDHCLHQVALPTPSRTEKAGHPQPAHRGEHRLGVAVRERPLDREQRLRRDQPLAPEHAAQGLDLLGGPVGEVGEGALVDLLPLASGDTEQNRGWRGAVGDDVDVHGINRVLKKTNVKHMTYQYMGLNSGSLNNPTTTNQTPYPAITLSNPSELQVNNRRLDAGRQPSTWACRQRPRVRPDFGFSRLSAGCSKKASTPRLTRPPSSSVWRVR